jgi:hypothetical protein
MKMTKMMDEEEGEEKMIINVSIKKRSKKDRTKRKKKYTKQSSVEYCTQRDIVEF